jgi:putative phosphoribosyl transferase
MTARMFSDRADAGRQLAEAVARLGLDDPVVFGLARGGIVVAAEVAKLLKAPLDVVLVRKLGAPYQPELALGAVVDGGEPETVLNDDIIRELGVPDEFIRKAVRAELDIIERQRQLYVGERWRPDIAGRSVILVDDGLATGATMRAALHAVRRKKPREVIVAAPVGALETIGSLSEEAERIVCLATPEPFAAVGSYYRDFSQVGDSVVVDLLSDAGQSPSATVERARAL